MKIFNGKRAWGRQVASPERGFQIFQEQPERSGGVQVFFLWGGGSEHASNCPTPLPVVLPLPNSVKFPLPFKAADHLIHSA